ncbi:hypothetical protein [Saccharopolyspora erythraea]|uniref:Uncharacterized protein n=1 Tax=Saccharopolyspora erythraea TaxID=1836 RepID=A0ABN1BWU5_SACER|nr:hypothetical protein [Saccharopolyspora erythraea]QRK88827.1 hypothetical protein JQX30_30125 [Saccharopolyspora erythraea]
MSVDDIAQSLDVAIGHLPIKKLDEAVTLIGEALDALNLVASDSNDPDIAEVLLSWQQSAVAIGNSATLCVEFRKRVERYKSETLGVTGAVNPGEPRAPETDSAKPQGRALIDREKFKYFFGKVKSGRHNTARSRQLITELNGIRIFDTPAGRGALRRHLEDVVRSDANIIRTYTDEFGTYQIRDSLLAGPGGFLQLETAWQVTPQGLRLTTIIPRRGRK